MRVDNSKGQILYGMHFYPGVAQYDDPGNSFKGRIFLNEDTIRQMDPSFAGRPIFVDHVEGVDENLDNLKQEADGWVIESFYNAADGKHWAKFIIVSDRGLEAVKRGYKLSNAYFPVRYGPSGTWNGVDYQKEIVEAEYEHLAIVQNPRYDESIIMSPEQFKRYNSDNENELSRIANSKKGEHMKLNIFKRQRVENSVDLEGMIVELPKSKKEVSLTKIVNEYDAILNMNGYANGDHMVKMNEKEEMSVNDLVKAHQAKCNELDELKKKHDAEGDEMDKAENDEDMDSEDMSMDNDIEDLDEDMASVGDRGGDVHLNEEEEEEEDKKKNKKMNNAKALDEARKVIAREKALRLKNANTRIGNEPAAKISLSRDQVNLGKKRYGSGQ